MSTQNTVIGILGGIAVGAIAGILLAPDKGSKTRAKIAESAEETKDNIIENINSATDSFSEKIEELKKVGNDILEKGKTKLSKVEEKIAS